MSFGLQTFKANGDIDFNSDGYGVATVVERIMVSGNTTIYPRLGGPYKVIIMKTREGVDVTPVYASVSGSTVSITYTPFIYQRSNYWTQNVSALVLVCK